MLVCRVRVKLRFPVSWRTISRSRAVLFCLTACDIYRPAAIDQLKVLGEQVGVEVYAEPENKDAVKIAKAAIEHAKKNNHRVVIVDTAGRLAVDEEMMNEIARLKEGAQSFRDTVCG